MPSLASARPFSTPSARLIFTSLRRAAYSASWSGAGTPGAIPAQKVRIPIASIAAIDHFITPSYQSIRSSPAPMIGKADERNVKQWTFVGEISSSGMHQEEEGPHDDQLHCRRQTLPGVLDRARRDSSGSRRGKRDLRRRRDAQQPLLEGIREPARPAAGLPGLRTRGRLLEIQPRRLPRL